MNTGHWLNSCLLGWGLGVLQVPVTLEGRWWLTGRPSGGEESARSFPDSHPSGRHWGARSPWVSLPDLVLWEGELLRVCVPSARRGGLARVVPTCSVPLNGLTPGLALSRQLRLFSSKDQEMGKENDFIYSLSCLLDTDAWSSLSGPWRLKLRDGGTLISPSCQVSGLGEEEAWTENVRVFLFLFFLFLLSEP